VFSDIRAANVTTDHINKYIAKRQIEAAANATINRELSALKRMFSLGMQSTSPKVRFDPYFPHLKENNTRKGFVDDAQLGALRAECSKVGLSLRAMVEVGATFAWHKGELENLRVNQVDLSAGTIRLEPGETKNDEGRTAEMPFSARVLLQACVTGKRPGDRAFTRDDGGPVQHFRKWYKVCCSVGLGRMVCKNCDNPLGDG
jgi:integrase